MARSATLLATAALLAVAGCGKGPNTEQGAADARTVPPAAENQAVTSTTPATGSAPAPAPGTAAAVDSATYKHHSTLAGAAVGAAAGHMLGVRHGAVLGAAAGALIQHERNKREAARPH